MKYLKLFEDYVTSIYEEKLVKNKKSGNIYPVQNFNPKTQEIPTKEEIEKAKEKESGNFKPVSKAAITSEKKKLDGVLDILKNEDDDTKKRGEILIKNWNKFLEAKTEQEQIDAIKELADNNLIEGHSGGKKIYLSSNTALPYKYLTGASGTSVTELMNKIIKDQGIPVQERQGGKDRELADMSGKHNESGVVAYLFGDKQTMDDYKNKQETLKKLGADETRFDKINKEAAEEIKKLLPEGAKITGAQQVGGIGETALKKLGIDPKVDPTDLILQYKDKDGNDKIIKVSAKTYSDPRSITMKNSGVTTAGETYLGDAGKSVDEKFKELRKKYAWDDSMSSEEKSKMKKDLKQAYLTDYSDAMSKLTETDKGQSQLEKMWQEVHGCGKDVYTQVINKTTGEVKIHAPDHYCKPNKPFKVNYDGVKMTVEMDGIDDTRLEIVMKTEDKGSPKLLFNHVKKEKKK